ncbi:hypothetical protein BDY24DRAFT_442548 [Mrakia frigida]|uniref:uncharacterized protein n=1 Tax=Mrakia frigida TaxID=29902 RepID=UPI003FCC1DA0
MGCARARLQGSRSFVAVLGRVSYDFLISTAPILYEKVLVISREQLEALFCEREEVKKTSTPSRISPLLSLSQMRTLDLDFTYMIPLAAVKLVFDLSSSRLVDSEPIPLDSIYITCTEFHSQTIIPPLYSSLLPRLNPIRLSIETFTRFDFSIAWIDVRSPRLEGWTRLQVLQLRSCLPFSWTRIGTRDHLGALPPLSLDRHRTLRLHVTTFLDFSWPHPSSLLNMLMDRNRAIGLDLMQKGSIVLVVDCEKQKEEAEEGLRVVMKEKWRDLFVIEMEE